MSDILQSDGPLSGVRILDLSRVLAGPWAVQLLADMGAKVIKVERPGSGDDARQMGPPFVCKPDGTVGDSAFFLASNRNKRSITLDISKPAGADIVRKLVAQSDVLMENFKVGDLKRYGLDFESLSKLYPRLIYCSITGFGQTGPYSHRPGYDAIFQAMSGLMSVTGPADGEPGAGCVKVGPSICDIISGLFAVGGIGAALYERSITGKGRWVEIGLLDGAVAAMSHYAQTYLTSGIAPPRRGTEGNGGMPARLFNCSDKDIMITAGNDRQFASLCKAMGLEHLISNPRFAKNASRVENRKELTVILDQVFRSNTLAYWLKALEDAGVPAGPVYNLKETFEDAQILARHMVIDTTHPYDQHMKLVGMPIKFSGADDDTAASPPPLLGQHTCEILSELGFSRDEIHTLRERNII